MKGTCPFCPMFEDNDADVIIITPLNPVTLGHKIVIPRQHVEDFTSRVDVTVSVMEEAAYYAKNNVEGDVNLITSKGANATQTAKHLHVHIVPRRKGDGLLLPWSGDQALTKQKEEIDADHIADVGKMIEGLRMEMIAHDGVNRGCEDCAYNNAVDEFNQKLDNFEI